MLLLAGVALTMETIARHLIVPVGGSCGAIVVLLAIAAVSKGIYSYAETLAQFLGEREQVTAMAERDRGEEDGRDKDLDELLRLNRTQMQAYQMLSRGQQRSAFRSSLLALFVGLVVLVGGVVVVVLVEGNTSKVAVAGVTALGSALSSYIASTYLKLQREAARQLRFFSDQPIVTSYIYEAERLVSRLPAKNQPETYAGVIKDVLGLAQHPARSYLELEDAAPASGGILGRGRRGAPRKRAEPASADPQG